MCGIAGYFSKSDDAAPIGEIMLGMLGALGTRGPDSAGVALYGEGSPGRDVAWIRIPTDESRGPDVVEVLRRVESVARLLDHEVRGGMIRVEVGRLPDARVFCRAVERPGEDVEVVSVGAHLELVKQVGSPSNLERTFHIGGFRGSHAIGHTRLSTESRVDLSHSQPFWARGVADLAIVHNGHITNYHRLRRIYEQEGARFFTENDSEVIGLYLARELAHGRTLEEAIVASLDDLDGAFTYLVATPDTFGYARDPFAFKPLIIVETDHHVAIANEEVAIRAAAGEDGVAHEPSGHVYRLWRRDAGTTAAAPDPTSATAAAA